MRPRRHNRLAVVGVGLLMAGSSVLGIGVSSAGATAPPVGTLHGEGGSFAEPVVGALEADTGLHTGSITTDYFNSNVDTGRDDFASGAADFAVSEFPLTSTQAATAATNHRSFAYVPFAANAVALGAVIECSADITLKSTTMCPNLQLTSPLVSKIFTNGITQWNSAALDEIGAGNPINPEAASANVTQLNLIDPSAGTFGLTQYIESSAAGKSTWDAWLSTNKVASDAPGEIWPTDIGLSGGDLKVVDSLVPVDPSTNLPRSNPQVWGQGDVGPVPADWLNWQSRGVPTIALENAAGSYVSPTLTATQAALNDATFNASTNQVTFVANSSDKAAYPIVQMSYLVVPTTGLSAAKAAPMASLIRFALSSEGQKDIEALGAAPPTEEMIAAGETVANTVAAEGATTTTTTTTSTTTAPTTSTSPTTAQGNTGSGGDSGSGAAASSGSALAFTGANVWPIAGVGVALLVIALPMRRRLRRKVIR